MELSERDIKEFIDRFPECPVEKLMHGINNYDESNGNLDELYEVLKWIEDHEVELSRLRRMVEEKILNQRFKDVKV